MYAQEAKNTNTLLRNGAYGIVMRGVQKCTCAGASLRGRNSAPLCCIKLDTATDSCCGSGGFFLATLEFLTDPANYTLDREQKEFLNNQTFFDSELVPTTFKLALMNLYLHNIGDIYGDVPVARGDSLLTDPGWRVDYVLTNPPFGKKSSLTFTNETGEQEEEDLVYNRQDFWTTSSNKQLNFVQHINTILKATGKAAVVAPDNVLFESQLQ